MIYWFSGVMLPNLPQLFLFLMVDLRRLSILVRLPPYSFDFNPIEPMWFRGEAVPEGCQTSNCKSVGACH